MFPDLAPPPPSPRRTGTLLSLVAAALMLLGSTLTGCSNSAGDASAGATTEARPTPTTVAPSIPADRKVDIHVPPGYRDGTPAPLLILLHGYGFDGSVQSAYLHLQEATDAAGVLYAFPDGTINQAGDRYWNATDACCAANPTAVDDSGYIRAIIAQAEKQYDVDPHRVYVMGHSNGGFMSYRLACDHADQIAAIVSIAGATYQDTSKCSPSEPVATLEVHGTADRTIKYDGGTNNGHRYPNAPTTAKSWATYDGCNTTPDSPAPPDRQIVSGLPPATVTSYSQACRPGGHAELWTQPGGKHIPIWTKDFSTQIVDWLLAHPKP